MYIYFYDKSLEKSAYQPRADSEITRFLLYVMYSWLNRLRFYFRIVSRKRAFVSGQHMKCETSIAAYQT